MRAILSAAILVAMLSTAAAERDPIGQVRCGGLSCALVIWSALDPVAGKPPRGRHWPGRR